MTGYHHCHIRGTQLPTNKWYDITSKFIIVVWILVNLTLKAGWQKNNMKYTALYQT